MESKTAWNMDRYLTQFDAFSRVLREDKIGLFPSAQGP